MRLGGRIQAAIEVIETVQERHRPISEALKDWGHAHRFAGSGDRAAIGNLVYDAFRKKRSLTWRANSDTPAALAFATVMLEWGMSEEHLRAQFEDGKHAPEMPNDEILTALKTRNLSEAPLAVQADLPDWLQEAFEDAFGDEWLTEAKAMCERPSLDVRVNTLKSNGTKVLKELSRFNAKPANIAREGIRIAAGASDRRLPNLQSEEGFRKGWFEIQDEGSQIAADLVFARPGEKVLDFCAGAGGKALALSAVMENKGQVHAFDIDKSRLAPIYDRIKRAGCRNVQVHQPKGDDKFEALKPLVGKMDRVLVDAPCSGAGTWRRHPEAKWKLTADAVQNRISQQADALNAAAEYVRPGGFLIYITCSVLPAENEEQVAAFADDNLEFELVSLGEVWQDLFGFEKPHPWSVDLNSVTLTPASTGTDGFFVSVFARDG